MVSTTVPPGAMAALLRDLASTPAAELPLAWPRALGPGSVVGRFELLRELGRGGFGVVYEARDRMLGRLVAFKAVRPGPRAADLKRQTWLWHEAEAAAQLSHPNIVTLYDVGTCELGPYLVFELLHGETLGQRLEHGPLAFRDVFALATSIARGLAYAHAAGVLHRDIKPANVFLTEDGSAKIVDFGLAHVFGTSALGGGGTPAFMAPEQWRGDANDPRIDVFGLGAIAFAALAGRAPYEFRDGRTTALDGAAAPRPPGDDVPAAFADLVQRCLEVNPDERPRDGGAVLQELLSIERSLASPRRKAFRFALGATAAMSIAGAAAVAWLVDDRVPASDNPLADARFLKLTDFDGIEQAAAISRDGRFVAFQSDRDGPMDVWITQLGTGQFTNLTRGAAPEMVNESLRALAFSRDGTLVTYWARLRNDSNEPDIGVWASPLLGGPPRPYLEGVAEFDWSSDGARLVYHTPGPGDPMYVRDGESSEARKIFSAPAGLHGHFLVWSPDHAFVYFVQGSPPDPTDIWRIKPTGGAPERVTSHDARVSHPVFVNARTLLYLATDSDGRGPWIYSLDVDERVPRRVTFGIDSYTSLAASADGKRLAATVTSPKRTFWRVPLDGGKGDLSAARRIPLITGNGSSPRLGPDFLVYVSSRGDGDSVWKLQGGTATEVWGARETRIIGAPAIARDGKRIAFTARQAGRSALYIANADGTGARVLTRELELHGAPAWKPDGRSLTVATRVNGAPRLYDVPLDGSSPAALVSEHSADPAWSPRGDLVVFSGADVGTTFPVKAVNADASVRGMPAVTLSRGARHVSFTPDGRSLLVLRGTIRHKNLWSIELTTGVERQVTSLPPEFSVRDFDISPDGRELVLEQVQEHADIVLIELARR